MATTRIYKVKDVEMLLASKTIAGTLSENLGDLSIARSNWNETYVSELSTKIDNAIDNYLGLDKKKELRDATSTLSGLQVPALRDLSFIKTQIEVDFDNEAEAIIKNLGFGSHLRAAQQSNQEALIQLLYAFKKGMTDDLKSRIVQKGTNPALIERIISYADRLIEANVTQESLKETTKEITEEAVTIFNEIYNEIIGICKIASNFYQYDTLKKEQFTFSKVVSNMNATRKIGEKGEEITE